MHAPKYMHPYASTQEGKHGCKQGGPTGGRRGAGEGEQSGAEGLGWRACKAFLAESHASDGPLVGADSQRKVSGRNRQPR